jgi:LysM repeat protein
MPTNYTIKSGDTLSQIAEDNNTTVTAILKANPSITNAEKIRQG